MVASEIGFYIARNGSVFKGMRRKGDTLNKILKEKKHWVIVAIASLMYMGSLGLVSNTIGVYYMPVSEDLGILTGTFSVNATLTMLYSAFGSLLAPRLLERFGWKKTIGLGAILAALGMMGMGFTRSVAIFNILGAIRGLGLAFSAMVPVAALISNWFERMNGVALSIATASSGIVSVVLSPVLQRLIENIGWEKTFVVNGILILVFFIPAIFVPYEFKPESEGLLPYGAMKTKKPVKKDAPLQSPVRTKDYMGITFIALLIVTFLQTFAVGLVQHLPTYSISIGATPKVASFTLSAVMIGNVSTKLIIGYLSDRIGVVKSMLIFGTINIIALALLVNWSGNTGLMGSSLIYGSAYFGGVAHVLMTKEMYGTRIGSYVNAPIVFVASSAGAIGNVVIGYFYDFTGSYIQMFFVIMALQVIAMIALVIAQKNAPAKID